MKSLTLLGSKSRDFFFEMESNWMSTSFTKTNILFATKSWVFCELRYRYLALHRTTTKGAIRTSFTQTTMHLHPKKIDKKKKKARKFN